MKHKLITIIAGLAVCLTSVCQVAPASAAIPCHLNEPMPSTISTNTTDEAIPAISLVDALRGTEPANRDGARKITESDDQALQFNVVTAGENILRCMAYETEIVLLDNATPDFRYSTFGITNRSPEEGFISDIDDSGLYVERVENPMELVSGQYLVDFVAQIHNSWISGEMVFREHDGELYLDSTWIANESEFTGENHTVDVSGDETLADSSLEVKNGDTITFTTSSRDANVSIAIRSEERGETVFRGTIVVTPGPESRNIFLVQGMEPGDYVVELAPDGDGGPIEMTVTVTS